MHIYERFSMYRFAIDYPNTWRVEFGPKAGRSEGYVIFRSLRNERVFLSWGRLEKIGDKYDSLKAQAKAGIAKIADSRNVRKLDLIETKTKVVNGHEAALNHFSVERAIGMLLLRVDVKDWRSIHLRCLESGRFFVIYESVLSSPAFQQQKKLWVEEGLNHVYTIVKNLSTSFRIVEPRNREVVSSGEVDIEDPEYKRYRSTIFSHIIESFVCH